MLNHLSSSFNGLPEVGSRGDERERRGRVLISPQPSPQQTTEAKQTYLVQSVRQQPAKHKKQ